jgi:hypothetical protein
MSQNYDNEKKFCLFKNLKGDNQARPDYRGELTLEGKVYRISGWIKEIKNGPRVGEKFIGGSVDLDPKKNGAAQPKAAPSDPSKSAYDKPATGNNNTEEPPPF